MDKTLFNKIKSGDRVAFNTLFNTHYTPLVRFAFTFLQDKDEAEEVIQDIFVRIWEQRASINITTNIKSYLFSSARNRSINKIKSVQTRQNILSEINQYQTQTGEHGYNESAELKTAIEEAIKQLPEKCQTIFLLSREEELTYKQIAQKLNLSEKTIENQMGIALKKLRITLSPYLNAIILIITLFLTK